MIEKSSWRDFVWGLLNGLLLGIFFRYHEGYYTTDLYAKIIGFFSSNISPLVINIIVFALGVIGFGSVILKAIYIYKEGWTARVIAVCSFVSMFLVIFNFVINFAVLLMITGFLITLFFPYE